MKATATAPANIAFIKYWGKKDDELRLPINSSISMNLSEAHTTTTVEFKWGLKQDQVIFLGDENSSKLTRPLLFGRNYESKEALRVIKHLDRFRKIAKLNLKAEVVTRNNFPRSTGVASSASGFAALTVAAASALGLKLSEKELTIFARLGSGSACRSIPDGFVIWEAGKSSETSFAQSLYPESYWDLCDILVIVKTSAKKVSSTVGMELAKTSPFFTSRLLSLPLRIEKVRTALKKKNFRLLGETIEEECVNMHAVMMTQTPPLFYWNGATLEIIKAVREWREGMLPVYFTVDAGPNVHLICESKYQDVVLNKVKQIKDIERIIVNKPASGTHLVYKHLF